MTPTPLTNSLAATLALMARHGFHLTCVPGLSIYQLKGQDHALPVDAETANHLLAGGLVSLSPSDDETELSFFLTAEGRRVARGDI